MSAIPGPVPAQERAALLERLRSTRVVPDPWEGDRSHGVGPADLRSLLDRWADGYDWGAEERRIAALPWELVDAGDTQLRVVHQRADRADASTVVLLHGWPDSVLRFERLLPLLTDVDVVVPALPGFPFSVERSGPAGVGDVADAVAAAMESLGYGRYTLSGGDVGGDVAEVLAARHPDRVASLHLANVSARHVFGADPASLDPESRDFVAASLGWNQSDGGYISMQVTRPRTLAVGLGDSPAGLAAWILEKLQAWSDDAAASFTTDELITWISAYWYTRTIESSFAAYAVTVQMPDHVDVPTVVSIFPPTSSRHRARSPSGSSTSATTSPTSPAATSPPGSDRRSTPTTCAERSHCAGEPDTPARAGTGSAGRTGPAGGTKPFRRGVTPGTTGHSPARSGCGRDPRG